MGVHLNLKPLKERIQRTCNALCCGGNADTMANDVSELETRITFHSIGAEREGDGRGSKDHGLNTEQIRLADDHSRVALGGSNETNQAVSAVTVIPEPDERYTPSPAIAQRRKQNASAVDGLAVFLLNEARPEEETVYSAPSTSSKEDVSYDKRSQNRSLVCNKCWQHFYTGPQILQPFISNSSITYTASLDELENSINNCSMCRFFLKSIQLRQKSTENYLEIGSPSERFLLEVSTGTKTKHPNPETAWLAVHCNELRVGTFVVFSDDPTTASYIRRRDMNFDVGSDASYQLAKTWLQECVEEHEGCPKYEQQPLPARVLDVTPIDGSLQHQIRLCVPNGEAAAYTTLSYCWGGPQPFSTQKSTLETLMKGIDMQQLPSTICDAITVTRRLGLRYLWVDAFCIIQDDDLDKQKEIARMGEIYQHSYCTIIAECAAKVSDGFLHKKPEPPDCSQYRLPYVVPDGGVGTMLLRSQEAYGYDPLEEPLNARGWTLQERLLPPRQLLYTSRSLRWKCQSREYVDGGVTFNMYDEPYLYSMTRVLDVASGKLPTPDLGNGVIDPWNPWGFWKRLIMEFSRRLCTDPADRVRAIGGIAKEFQKVWSPGSRYLAGHPECYLFESLAWRVDPFKMASRRGGYRAPSWSWMAAEGVIIYDEEPKSSQRAVEVLECNVTPTLSFTPFGDISHGVLKLHGYVREARWLSDSQGAQHIHFTHDLEFLEDSQNQHGYTVTVFPDSVEDIVGNGVVWCLITSASRTAACGLVLDVVEAGERCFRRVGYFNLASHRWAYGLGLDSSSDKHQVITIV